MTKGIDHDWKPIKTYPADEYNDRPDVIEEKRILLNSTWRRWKCGECGRVIQSMAPCEWNNEKQIRSSALNWSHEVTYNVPKYCCGDWMR